MLHVYHMCSNRKLRLGTILLLRNVYSPGNKYSPVAHFRLFFRLAILSREKHQSLNPCNNEGIGICIIFGYQIKKSSILHVWG